MKTLRDAREGAKWGAIMAVLLSTWVMVLSLFQGSLTFASSDGKSYYAPAIVALYVLGGVMSGVMIGVLRGLLRWRAGAVVVGILAATPLAVGLTILEGQFGAWGRHETLLVIIFSVAFGGGGGLIVRQFVRNGQS